MSATVAHAESRMTVEEYLAWAEGQPKTHCELVDGVPFRMSPERNVHALVKGAVYLAFSEAVRSAGAALVVFVDGPTVATGRFQAREPDVVIHPRTGIDWDATVLERPLILVEVTSPSTRLTDVSEKVDEYVSLASVQHYLIVDPQTRSVVHHSRGEADEVVTTTMSVGLLDLGSSNLSLDVARFFEDLPPSETH